MYTNTLTVQRAMVFIAVGFLLLLLVIGAAYGLAQVMSPLVVAIGAAFAILYVLFLRFWLTPLIDWILGLFPLAEDGEPWEDSDNGDIY